MPPQVQAYPEVATLIESTIVYQNSANYEMAIKTLEEARDMWRKLANPQKVMEITKWRK